MVQIIRLQLLAGVHLQRQWSLAKLASQRGANRVQRHRPLSKVYLNRYPSKELECKELEFVRFYVSLDFFASL